MLGDHPDRYAAPPLPKTLIAQATWSLFKCLSLRLGAILLLFFVCCLLGLRLHNDIKPSSYLLQGFIYHTLATMLHQRLALLAFACSKPTASSMLADGAIKLRGCTSSLLGTQTHVGGASVGCIATRISGSFESCCVHVSCTADVTR